ncbi:hypothetical protein IRJ41_005253 [Triplophysa rosa]|uniref:Uncharacterized protein n=1 Tax=Triplophysa rosa TaxID=992332 RepID=A0A9W8C3E9_TRIRA|nr:hypothetical protein IRJ41_005253 [Triplophysa rosa]
MPTVTGEPCILSLTVCSIAAGTSALATLVIAEFKADWLDDLTVLPWRRAAATYLPDTRLMPVVFRDAPGELHLGNLTWNAPLKGTKPPSAILGLDWHSASYPPSRPSLPPKSERGILEVLC